MPLEGSNYPPPWSGTPRPLLAGGTIETQKHAARSRTLGIVVYVSTDDATEYVAVGRQSLRLVPLTDVQADAELRGWTLERSACSWVVES